MVQTFAVDSNSDLFLDKNGNISIYSELSALLQICEQIAKTRLGELIFQTDGGIPYFETVFIGSPNLSQFKASLRAAWLAVDGVLEVVSLVTVKNSNVLNYTAEIRTVFGQGSING